MGISALAITPIEELSGVIPAHALAVVMVQQALVDEPFTGVDEATSRELMALIVDMHRQGQTILAVLHDNQCVADFFPRDAAA